MMFLNMLDQVIVVDSPKMNLKAEDLNRKDRRGRAQYTMLLKREI